MSSNGKRRLVTIGYGYVATGLAEVVIDHGWQVAGTSRSSEKRAAMAAKGIDAVAWSAGESIPDGLFQDGDDLVVSAGPDEAGCSVLAAVQTMPPPLRSVLYLSSTGVYGDTGGAWIDESAPCAPSTDRGRRRVAAEAGWQDWAERTGTKLTLCRLSGIYGPGRNAIESLRSGRVTQRAYKPGQVFNRIHRDDIVKGLVALLHEETPPVAVNFADDEPSPPQDVIAHAADLLGVAAPPLVPLEDAALSDMGRSFYAENKRLKNDLLKDLIGGELVFPTYRDGLQAILKTLSS